MMLITRAGTQEGGGRLAGLNRNPGICTVDYLIQGETSPCRCLDICWSGLLKSRGIVRFRMEAEKRAVKVQNARPGLSRLSDITFFFVIYIASCGKYHSTAFTFNYLYCSSNSNCRKAAGKQFSSGLQ